MEPPGPIPNPEVKRCSANGSETIGLVRVGRRQVYARLQVIKHLEPGSFLPVKRIRSKRSTETLSHFRQSFVSGVNSALSSFHSALRSYLLRPFRRRHSLQIYDTYEVRLPCEPLSRCGL